MGKYILISFGLAFLWLAWAITPQAQPPDDPRCPGETFTDVCPGDYFYEPVLSLNAAGIISGYNASPPCDTQGDVPCFKPANNLTRGQTAKIVALAVGYTGEPTTESFQDVPATHTFYIYIENLASHNILSGYTCGQDGEPCVPPDNKPYFRPGATVTRGQLAKVVSQSFGYSEPYYTRIFQDVGIGSTYYDFTARMANRNIINGYPCGGANEPCEQGNLPYFRPNNPVTRAQTSKMIYIARSLVTPTPTPEPTPTTPTK